jgi:hypothetical protein
MAVVQGRRWQRSAIRKRVVHFVHTGRRVVDASTGENSMHEEHRKAAERHELAAHAHPTAAGHTRRRNWNTPQARTTEIVF